MPKLILLAAAQRVIIDPEDNSASLIAMIEEITVPVPPSGLIEDMTAAGLPWALFALWQREPGDEETAYEQRVRLIAPDKSVAFDQSLPFQMTKLRHRITFRGYGFPIRQEGVYTLEVSLRGALDKDRVVAQGEYAITVKHQVETEQSEIEAPEATTSPQRKRTRRPRTETASRV
jgi:hypothetical protein